MSALPVEVLMYILKWVVSADLDIASLEQLALVCRGFYICVHDEELWRLICHRSGSSGQGHDLWQGSQ